MDLPGSLEGKLINGEQNLFMLSPVAHKFYDDLLLSFSPTKVRWMSQIPPILAKCAAARRWVRRTAS